MNTARLGWRIRLTCARVLKKRITIEIELQCGSLSGQSACQHELDQLRFWLVHITEVENKRVSEMREGERARS